jgi:branched-chain amino acid transport system substrate-binding protein
MLPPEPVVAQPREEESVLEELQRLDDSEGLELTTYRIERALQQAEDPTEVAALRVLLAETLEKRGRPEEAMIAYCTLSSSSPEPEFQARAWDGVARIRAAEGDDAGAVRARMRAWELAPSSERHGRTEDLRQALAALPAAELRSLSRETFDLGAFDQVEAELSARGDPGTRPDDEFAVAVLAPFTGRFEKFGNAFLLGVQIALEERDRSEPDSGAATPEDRVPVRLSSRDTGGDVLAATKLAREVVLEDGVLTILGPLLSVTSIGAGSVAQAYGVPLVAPTATDPGVPEIGRFVLTLQPSARELTEPLADFSVNELGNVRHGILVPREAFAEELEREFRQAVEARGAQAVITVSYEPDQTDFRHLLERLDEAAVDAVYAPGPAAHLEKLAPQLDFYEFGTRILGHGGWLSPRVLDAGNLALQGGIFTVTPAEHPESEFTARLRTEVWRRSGEEVSRFHVHGYRAMAVVLAAVDLGARDAEEIVEVLRRREHWRERPEAERIDIVTFRDGALGPAAWATGFDLTPPIHPDDREALERADSTRSDSE